MRDVRARWRAFWVRRVLRRPIVFRDRYGIQYALEPTDDLALYFTHRGWFEEPEQEFCRRYLRAGMTVFDVGAYIGVYTCFMAALVGPRGAVHAFEPFPESFERLRRNLTLNGLTNVVANRQALFSRSGTQRLHVYVPPFQSLSSVVHAERARAGGSLRAKLDMSVEAVSLDDYCRARAVTHIDLLKLDVEDAEVDVLAGAPGLLAEARIGCLLFEIGTRAGQVVERLRADGFQFFAAGPDGSLEPILEGAVARMSNAVALHRSVAGAEAMRDHAHRV
jgi:FkbM family methyltransferase